MSLRHGGARFASLLVLAGALGLAHCAPEPDDDAASAANAVTVACDGVERLSNYPPVGRIARDRDRLYWISEVALFGRRLESVRLDGTEHRAHAWVPGDLGAEIHGLDDSWLYIVDGASIVRVPKRHTAGAAFDALYRHTSGALPSRPTMLRLDGDDLYLAGGGSGTGYVAMMPKTGGAPVRLGGLWDEPYGLAVTPDLVYLGTRSERHVLPKANGGAAVPPSGMESTIEVDATDVWAYGRTTLFGPSRITRRPHGTPPGAPTQVYVAPGAYAVASIFAEGPGLYFTLTPPLFGGTAGTIGLVDRSGSHAARPLVTGLRSLVRVFTDADFVYWAEGRHGLFTGGGLFRVRKDLLERLRGPLVCGPGASPIDPGPTTPATPVTPVTPAAVDGGSSPDDSDGGLSPADAGAPGADASAPQPKPDPETDDGDPVPESPRPTTRPTSAADPETAVGAEPHQDGCSESPGHTSGHAPFALALAAALVASRRRRRHRSPAR